MAQQNDKLDALMNSQMEIDIKSVKVSKTPNGSLCELQYTVRIFVHNKPVGFIEKSLTFHADADSQEAVDNFFVASMNMIKKDLNAGEWQN
ncbi:hypothetical protein D3C75_135660 [compost metagenome]